MKELCAVLAFLSFGVALVADHNRQAPTPSWTTRGKVLRVIDGDTLEVEIRRTVRVRMLDCWAPESKQDPRLPEARRAAEKTKGQAARQNLNSLANGREVIVSVPLSDDGDIARSMTMGRVLGNVWLVDHPEKSLSVQQVEAGHATKEKPEELR